VVWPSGLRVSALTPDRPATDKERDSMEYGIGGILILVLVILAIIFFAKRV
jgi:hypothetical protein